MSGKIDPWLRAAIALSAFELLAGGVGLLPLPSVFQWPALLLVQLQIVAFMPCLAAPLAIAYFLARGIAERADPGAQRRCFGRAGVCLIYVLLIHTSTVTLREFRRIAFQRAADRAEPIVEALARHHSESGRYPEALEEIGPLPGTGLAAYPEFYYHTREDSYELGIFCTSGGINFDRFFYWPEGSYPPRGESGWHEPIGRWVYYHE